MMLTWSRESSQERVVVSPALVPTLVGLWASVCRACHLVVGAGVAQWLVAAECDRSEDPQSRILHIFNSSMDTVKRIWLTELWRGGSFTVARGNVGSMERCLEHGSSKLNATKYPVGHLISKAPSLHFHGGYLSHCSLVPSESCSES